MSIRKLFEQKIVKESSITNSGGYVFNNNENLVGDINIELFHDDLMQGSGNELLSKFNALYSSAALAVNNFAIVKRHLKDFSFLNYTNFTSADFERKFKTGLLGTSPNLDFTLESNNNIVAFESKYLELLNKKKVIFKSSYNKDKLKYLNDFWLDLIKMYANNEHYLDIAQLIKHAIGLMNYNYNLPNKEIKKVILVYVFWTPTNYQKFAEYQIHAEELIKFSNILENQNDIEFLSLTYEEFWKMYENNNVFQNHFEKMKTRYRIEI